MNLRQIEYILMIAQEKNITKAADKLFITQSALNQQLLKLEQELGSPIFVRQRSNWHLTPVGEIYLEGAKKIMRIKQDTYNQISDLTNMQNSRLRLGITTDRGQDMFVAIYPQFIKMHPHITVEARAMNVRDQSSLLRQGDLDLAYLTLSALPTEFDGLEVLRETLLLAVPSSNPLARGSSSRPHDYPLIDLSLFQNELFALFPHLRTIREEIDLLFKQAGFEPRVLSSMDSAASLLQMVGAGLCCTIVPEAYYQQRPDVTWFSFSPQPKWYMYAVWPKGSYHSKAAQDFVALSKDYWAHRIDNQCRVKAIGT